MNAPVSQLNIDDYYDAKSFRDSLLKQFEGVEYKPLASRIVIATYIEPEKTRGGVYRSPKSRNESRFQGKVGLVLWKGPTAFKYDGSYNYEGDIPDIGDWVLYYGSDGREFFMANRSMRSIDSELIHGILPDPEVIF